MVNSYQITFQERTLNVNEWIKFIVLAKMSGFLHTNVRDPRSQDPNFLELWSEVDLNSLQMKHCLIFVENGRLLLQVSIRLSSFHARVTSTASKACGKESIPQI